MENIVDQVRCLILPKGKQLHFLLNKIQANSELFVTMNFKYGRVSP